MKKMISRRNFLKVCAVAGSAVALSACGRTGNGANLQEIAARDHLFHGCSPFL